MGVEIFPGLVITLDLVVGLMIKVIMVILLLLSIIMVRQDSLMDRVVDISLGGKLKLLVWAFFILNLLMTVIVVLA